MNNYPTPAIVTVSAAQRVPRMALWLFCSAYVLAGFLGRDAWRSADMSALGYMAELAQGATSWFKPTLMGMPPEQPSLLAYWFGAWAMQLAPSCLADDLAVRLAFALLLGIALLSSWTATYYLARSPQAQPVAFAFGGEALPRDYARAMGDGGLLAFIACLGLAQLAHETTPELVQLSFAALFFGAVSALPYRKTLPAIAAAVGLVGLSLSGAPSMALLLGWGSAVIHALDRSIGSNARRGLESILMVLASLLVGLLSLTLGLMQWQVELPHTAWAAWNGYAQLLIWFTWPAWPLAMWTLWRWRHQWLKLQVNRHLALPIWFFLLALLATLSTQASDRTLLLGLPALASLAAFALPTLKRQVAALIDWFTLLFFSVCGITIWVVWIAMQTGVPSQPAANVARLAPGFTPEFSALPLLIALSATAAWAWLVQWRVGRHRAALWKSLVLPAAGSGLCWLLLMTLWMPLLNYARSYGPLIHSTLTHMDMPGCVETYRLSQAQVAAFKFYGKLQLQPLSTQAQCPWLLAEPEGGTAIPRAIRNTQWTKKALVTHPADREETVLVLKRK